MNKINKELKIALIHDYIKEFGGAERVLEALAEIYPNAPIYTSFYSPLFLGPHRHRFEKLNIHTTWFQKIPYKNKLLSYFRILAPFVFKKLNLTEYDVIITSATGTYTSPNFIKKNKKAKLICYCHTPPRYLYGYATAADWDGVWWRRLILAFSGIPLHFLRLLDFKSAQKVDYFIANSQVVSDRITKFYRRSSIIISPPVDINEVTKLYIKGDYYLAGGRLARPKHIDLAVLACVKNNLPLKVFGREFSGYGDELRKISGLTIEFLGEVDDESKRKLYEGAKAYIFCAEDEDFGIMPVEAMACGTPVIAFNSGGVRETVINGKTGLFFNELTVDSLLESIKKLDNLNINPRDCMDQAQKFSKEQFKKQIKEFIASKS